MNRIFNKNELIKNTVKVNIYYQQGTEMEYNLGNMIGYFHNSKINWRIEELKMTRYLEKQWRPKQEKLEW